jgi:putative serine protease PepD
MAGAMRADPSERNLMKRPSRTLTLTTAGLVAAAGVGVGGAATYAALSSEDTVVRQVTVEGSEPASSTEPLSVNEIYRRAYRGVVEITANGSAETPFGDRPQQALGSGFVYDDEGHIVTNQHVVDGASDATVRLWNGQTYDAEVLGTDASTDLAVLDVDAPASVLHPLALADSGEVVVGDAVVAIGSPFGLEQTVTSGIVSALHRTVSAPNDFSINDTIQTDAAINSGNSGGPLLNLQGRVIGVNAQIESNSGGNDGVGFAIPSHTVRSVVSQLVETGEVEHAYLGVGVQEIPPSVADELNSVEGVALTEVRNDTPASRAGLRAAAGSRLVDGQQYPTGGDVITAIDGKKITTSEELQGAIDAKQPGDTVSITYVRDGDSRTAQVRLASRPS